MIGETVVLRLLNFIRDKSLRSGYEKIIYVLRDITSVVINFALVELFWSFRSCIKSGGEKLKPLHAFVNTLIEVPHILKPGQFAKNIKQFIDPSVDLRPSFHPTHLAKSTQIVHK